MGGGGLMGERCSLFPPARSRERLLNSREGEGSGGGDMELRRCCCPCVDGDVGWFGS